jgi:hypothetical protein
MIHIRLLLLAPFGTMATVKKTIGNDVDEVIDRIPTR